MKPSSLPKIAPTSLRDHAATVDVERGWHRLEADLRAARGRSAPRRLVWLAPAAAAALFAGGVWVGARYGASSASVATPEHLAAARPAAEATPRVEPRAEPPEVTLTPEVQATEPARSAKGARVAPRRVALVAPSPAHAVGLPVGSGAPATAMPSWHVLGQQGDYEAARREVEALGGFDVVLERATAGQLMTLFEVARASRRGSVALAALRRVVERFPGDPNAPLAAYQLGTLLEKAGDRVGAAEAFAAARRLSPGGDLAEDVLIREFDDAVRRGDVALAQALANQHEREFPTGRRRAELRAKLARLVERSSLSPATPGEEEPAEFEGVDSEGDDGSGAGGAADHVQPAPSR